MTWGNFNALSEPLFAHLHNGYKNLRGVFLFCFLENETKVLESTAPSVWNQYMLLPLSSLGESEVQRGFAQVHNSGSPVKHRVGLPSPAPALSTLSHDWLHLPPAWVTTPLASFPTGNCSLSNSPFFTMEIRNRKRKHHDDTQLAPGFLDQNQIWCLWIWCQFAGCVTLGNYSSLLSCNFLMCKKKMILLAGWVANPSHSISLAQAFNLDSTSSSGPIQSHGHVGDS